MREIQYELKTGRGLAHLLQLKSLPVILDA